MPQPLRTWLPNLSFKPSALAERPILAIKIAQISAAWADIEVCLGLVLAVLLNDSARVGVSMYQALAGSNAREDTMLAAAQATLPDQLTKEFILIQKAIRGRARERNPITHGIWSAHPDHTDALVNCPPESLIKDLVHSLSVFQAIEHLPPPTKEFVRSLQIYRASDFDATLTRIEATNAKIIAFSHKISEAHQEKRLLARELMRRAREQAAAAPPRPATSPKSS